MTITPVTLVKGDAHGSETDYRDNLPVNMYAIGRKVMGADGYLINYPGIESFATGLGIDRGASYNEKDEAHYRVSGTRLLSISSTGVVTNLGAIPGTSQCRLIDFYSFNTQGIIADGKMFLYKSVGGLAEVIDADLGSPIDGVWVDQYYFLTDGDYIYHTDIDDETSIDPLKFATAEFMPDPSLGLAKSSDNKVMVFGRYSLEYFVNDASDNFAFVRVPTRAQKIGIVATHAKCEGGGGFFITGGRREEAVGIHAISIGSSSKISTREVDKVLSQYTESDLSDMRMEYRMADDIAFVLVHLPNETLCFNDTIAKISGLTSAWSILSTGVSTATATTYRAINGIFDARNSKWIYGDKTNTNIGSLNNSISTQYSELVEWLLFTPLLLLDGQSINQIELATIPGFATANDATVAVSLTHDGITFGREWWEAYGAPLAYGKKFIIRRLGYVADIVGFKFRGASTSRMAFALMVMDHD